jgi:methanogen homocitrate synthase
MMPSNEFYLSQFQARSKINPPKRVIIFDTSMRDGEQTPGVTYTNDEKIEIARKLDELGVPKIEASFA